MASKPASRVPKGEQRARDGRGVKGVRYNSGGYYLSAAQFGYTTAQSPTGDLTTATPVPPPSGMADPGAASA